MKNISWWSVAIGILLAIFVLPMITGWASRRKPNSARTA